MRPTASIRLSLSAAVVVLTGAALTAGAAPAGAGTFEINVCGADFQNERHSTQAFGSYANRGMRWKRGCAPVGKGTRGMISGNVKRSGRVKRNAQSGFVLEAPPATRFVHLKWSGDGRRPDCRYSLELYGWRPDGPPASLENVRANRNCSWDGFRSREHTTADGRPRYKNYPEIVGATKLIQRAVCKGKRRKPFCSARAYNWIGTFAAKVTVGDPTLPSVGIAADNPFTQGAWVKAGTYPISYNVSDNVGVKLAQPIVGGHAYTSVGRACDYARTVPCGNEPGHVTVKTGELAEGTQTLQVRAVDAADNANTSGAVAIRIDNTAPAAPALTVEQGDGWRASNAFTVSWVNPSEGDRAPIAAAHWRLCRSGTSQCTTGSQAGTGIARLADLKVPEPGQWELRVVREDAASNRNDAYASEPVTLRYDPEAPTLSFDATNPADPTRVSVAVADRVSGVAGGGIEIGAAGSNSWQGLPTRLEGDHLVARIPDEALPAGVYTLRAQAHDLAGNLGAATSGAINLPLRVVSTMQAGVAVTKTVTKTVKRKRGKGKKARTVRRKVRRKVTVLRPSGTVEWGAHATIKGRMTNRDGQPLPGQPIQVLGPGPNGEQLLAVLTTDAQGGFSYRAAGSASRTLRFAYAGSPVVLPAQAQVALRVPAAGSFKASRKRVLNGGRVVFRGRVASVPVPALGKLVEVQVRQRSGEWSTFRTLRTDAQGRWALRYTFNKTSCHTRYRLRVRIPAEAGYPFGAGHSKPASVLVRGAEGPCR
jgi:hypothetical protein